MKTAYIITPGLQLPESFTWRGAPTILAQPDLWDAMKTLPSGLLFRIRTEQNVGDKMNAQDRVESCVGLIDSTARWRACLGIIRTALSGLRVPETNEACWAVFGLMTSKHPATVTMQERQHLAGALRSAIEKLPGDDPRAAFEASVAAMMVRLAFAENDIEVAHIVPYSAVYMVNGVEYPDERQATVDVVASSMFLCEAFGRLCEKAPEWLFYPLPAPPGAAAAPTTPEKPIKAQEEVSEDDEAA
jgi:hypothetical protein